MPRGQSQPSSSSAPTPSPARLADLSDGRRVTPMLRQFLEIKQEVPDALLMFRMGDFYELFFEDAETAAEVLGLTLTARDKTGEHPIPMAGVPHHAARGYIQKLVAEGYRVAVADQVEDPKEARGLVRRALTEVITPGVILDPDNLDARSANYLVAVMFDTSGHSGLAAIDVSTGEFLCTELESPQALEGEIGRLSPSELLFCDGADDPNLERLTSRENLRSTSLPDTAFSLSAARSDLCELFGVAQLDGLGLADFDLGLRTAGAILHYLRASRLEALGHVRRLRPYRVGAYMILDDATRRNLELFRSLADGKRKGTLLGLLDRATTSMGSRRLRQWLGAPLLDPAAIEERLDSVEILVKGTELREAVTSRLALVSDVERLNGKVMSGRVTARDLVALRRSLQQVPAIDLLLDRADTRELSYFAPLPDLGDLCRSIEDTLCDEPPLALKDGGLIRPGFHAELDELVELGREGKGALARLESDERLKTGIGSLKVRYNRVFGYYIEVTKANLRNVPEHYIRKQTLANAERFYTPELKEFEAKVLGAEERRSVLEFELFSQLREQVASRAGDLAEVADRLAAIDALVNLAEVAVRYDYVRPTVDDGNVLHLEGSRHPVIEQMRLGERFVPNDIHLDGGEAQLLIISGPNMAGKSTVMRQVALTVLMAQAGSFVPAREAHVGVADRIFTRVGASDNLSRGQSTFMVEMAETAAILASATDRSLAVIDEIGRGTSTYDGVAIAWAVAEFIADTVRCRTLFATHYHELAELSRTRDQVKNFNISVSEMGGQVIFLRRLRPGGANRSYGIQVARLAGLPQAVIDRAKEILANLELDSEDVVGRPRLARGRNEEELPAGQLGLFADRSSLLKEALLDLDLDQLTPLEALNVLAELKNKADQC